MTEPVIIQIEQGWMTTPENEQWPVSWVARYTLRGPHASQFLPRPVTMPGHDTSAWEELARYAPADLMVMVL